MQNSLSDLTTEELYEIIERTVEKKIFELFNDEDLGLKLKDSVKQRLKKQDETVQKGDYGRKLKDAAAELGI